ncbi:MAG: class I SAM-dependent methyltransferase [Myxococcaceae bacterium]|nr:class I SAM-dependent methyltransferase [Myxococcaceae bacterium]
MTWSSEPSFAHVDDARRAAARWGLALYERPRKGSLQRALGTVADALLVRGGDGWTLVDAGGSLRVTPGLALLRLKRLASGGALPDLLLRHAGITAGETIVDATLGLAADARVLASAAGPTGRVIGLEASLPLAVLLSEGLALETPWPGSAPLEIVHARADTWLRAQPSRSVEVVFFDPMFERTKAASPAFQHLRRFAEMTAISRATIDEARRVARRLVLMKSSDPSLFPPLGLEPLAPSSTASVYWGRLVVR